MRVNGELIEQMLLGAPEPINSCLQKELLILHAQIHLEAQVYQVRQFTSVLKCIYSDDENGRLEHFQSFIYNIYYILYMNVCVSYIFDPGIRSRYAGLSQQ